VKGSLGVFRGVGLLGLLASLIFLLGTPPVAAAPALRIVSPTDGATVAGPDVTIQIEATDVTLVDGRVATRNEDLHTHYLLDIDPTPYLDGKQDMPIGDPHLVHSAATSNTFTDVAPGPHTVITILSYKDHHVSQPVVMAKVSFTVGPTTPRAGGGGGHGDGRAAGSLAAGTVLLTLLVGGLLLRRRARP
jgi:hypothetical protein